MGSKKRPFYRIIATDSRMPRDGRFIETLGYYDPKTEPAVVNIKEDLVFKWMERGARPTDNTERILRNAGVMKKWSLLRQGVSREELETKYEQLKASETPPMDREEKKKKPSAKAEAKAAAEAEAAAAEQAAEAETAPEPEPAGDAADEAKASGTEPEAGTPEPNAAAEPAEEEAKAETPQEGADEDAEKKS
jgi:small subunit ribosomal protein S16